MTSSSAAPPNFELQSHSTHSDGELSAAAVVSAAEQAGVELLALTDHDSVAGVGEATDAAAGLGLRLVSGVEISVLDPVARDLHMCGYLIDPTDAALGAQLAHSRGDRERRAQQMIEALEQDGWAVDQEQLDTRLAAGGTARSPAPGPGGGRAPGQRPAPGARAAHEPIRVPRGLPDRGSSRIPRARGALGRRGDRADPRCRRRRRVGAPVLGCDQPTPR